MVSAIHFKRTGAALKLLLCAVIALGMVLVPGLTTARADGGLELSTSYPGITVKAGTDATFSLKIANNTGSAQSVGLAVQSTPDGWKTSIIGGGNPISKVYVDNAAAQTATLNVSVPADTAEGLYNVVVTATGETGTTDTLNLELNVSEQEIKQGTFTTQYPSIQGPSTATFQFSTSLTNNSAEDQSYSLSANAPTGWNVKFTASGQEQEIASLSVPAGSSATVKVTVTPVYSVTAGKYTINCSAVSAKDTLAVDLNVEITGVYKLDLTSANDVLTADAYAGRETAVNLTLTNSGTSDISAVQLTATQPKNWSVRFDPSEVGTIKAGESKSVTAYIKAASDAIAGDYLVAFAASSAETQSQSSFRIAVKTSTTWGIIAIAIILVLVAGLVVMFMKFGRR
jgi:uncharacterized membrane protein